MATDKEKLTIYASGHKDAGYKAHVFLESYSVAIHTTKLYKHERSAVRAARTWIKLLTDTDAVLVDAEGNERQEQ